ncbi:HlyD family efflux transporter periplasmic adaptor subunit [Pseudanabaena sp. PCC 6802]|uniref:HlyD family efflux transporter periplasmic adaptor subunit n=1 Tax=Pseudanabaena sp. PCC 6802 TaxID=118173 RepID=UPI00034C9BD3|nr:HlyD family efflux transporter periplasmic adaptor subunit [Pseudanabaena sp. PCC 6802]
MHRQSASNKTIMAQVRDSQKTFKPWVVGAIAIATSLGVFAIISNVLQAQAPKPTETATATPSKNVTALGRIEPMGQVIKLSVINAQDSRVDKLLVQEGDYVKAEQVIAVLQGLDKKKAALAEAEQELAVQEAKLAQTLAGESKVGEIAAQEANIAQLEARLRTETAEKKAAIARIEAELRNDRITYQRYQTLHQEGAVNTSDIDEKRKNWETSQAKLDEAKAQLANAESTLKEQIRQQQATLDKLQEVRPVDVRVAQAQMQYSKTKVATAKADLDDVYVRVPVAGRILKINTRIGEQVNTQQGIVELGQTDRMYAIAEVYETDVYKIKPGQRARITSENGGFEGELQGTVDRIGLQIKKKNVLDSDPAADKDARVVEVKIRIDSKDSKKVEALTNLQTRISISLN